MLTPFPVLPRTLLIPITSFSVVSPGPFQDVLGIYLSDLRLSKISFEPTLHGPQTYIDLRQFGDRLFGLSRHYILLEPELEP